MNNDNILVEETDLELARNTCNDIEDQNTRNRAVANTLAADLAKKYFTEIEVDTETGLHKIATVLNNLDISDVYVKDSYIDVRIYFEGNELCVPKIHFEKNILPVAYMFIKMDSNLSGATVTGFALPENIDQSRESNGYYFTLEEDLVSYYDIEGRLVQNYADDAPDNFEALIFDYLDNKLEDDCEFYKALLNSRYCRNSLKNAANVQAIFEKIYNNESFVENLASQDSCLELSEDCDLLEENNEEGFVLDIEEQNSHLEEFENNLDINESEDLVELEVQDFEDINNIEEVQELSIETTDNNTLIQEDNNNLEEFQTLEEDSDFSTETLIEAEPLEIPEEKEILAEVTQPIEEETSSIESNYEEIPNFDQDETSELPIEEYSEIDNFTEEVVEENKDEDFSTVTTPSIDSIEQTLTEEDLESMLDNDKSVFDEEETVIKDSNPQIENLFGNEEETQEVFEEEFVKPAKSNSKLLPLLGTLTLAVALGYYGYTKFINPYPINNETSDTTQAIQQNTSSSTPKEDAMPVESIENIESTQAENEGNAISIPAIEQNLDASILVSNLSVNWEVPAGYVSNNTAKRYFTKMGKIIQLNLKTELLLLSKPPITNKIMLELEFNKATNKFGVKGITASSGEKIVDDLIIQTVKNALDINLKTNMSTFNNIAGNPVLVIRL